MELKEFITNTLISVVEGVSEAKKQLLEKESTAVVNATKGNSTSDSVDDKTEKLNRVIYLVDMDIAVTTSESSSNDTSGKLNIKIIEIGKGKGSENINSTASRIKFSIPIAYPL